MIVHTFPRCCGAGVLIIESMTGRGETADLELIKRWVAFAKRNGFRMYDYCYEYTGTDGRGGKNGPMSSIAVIDGPGDQKEWNPRYSWGMLLAMTNPSQTEAASRLEKFGFTKLMTTTNPWYSVQPHNITLWGLDLNTITREMLETVPVETAMPAGASLINS